MATDVYLLGLVGRACAAGALVFKDPKLKGYTQAKRTDYFQKAARTRTLVDKVYMHTLYGDEYALLLESMMLRLRHSC
jgi:hypothetical protein